MQKHFRNVCANRRIIKKYKIYEIGPLIHRNREKT
jgi:hypothetical protein